MKIWPEILSTNKSHGTRNRAPVTFSPRSPLLLLFLVFFLFIVTARAWVCDDAFITFRTIDNLFNGHGPTWNIDERVQVFTHPLWFLFLSLFFAITGELVLTSIFLSIVISGIAVWLLAGTLSRSMTSALLSVLLLGLSSSFVDYSTSGLENPLTHLLLVLFLLSFLKSEPTPTTIFFSSLIAAACGLNRLDILVFCIPVLVYSCYKLRTFRGFIYLLLGQLPLASWLVFSLIYYGTPIPNTAYAKLNTGIPASQSLLQGFRYLLDSFIFDPLAPVVILAALPLSLFLKERRSTVAALGIVLYLFYILRIGGDFMSGRFLTAPLILAVGIISRFDFSRLRPAWSWIFFVIATILALCSPHPTLFLTGLDEKPVIAADGTGRGGIIDERAFYYSSTGLFSGHRWTDLPRHPWRQEGTRVRESGMSLVVTGPIGMYGYYAGPAVHIVDHHALADPLLARLPAIRDINWRPGHFKRIVPRGYLQTLRSGSNRIEDGNLAAYYERLSLLTRGALFDRARAKEIWNMLCGAHDHLIDFNAYRFPEMVQLSIDEVDERKTEGTPLDHPGNVLFTDSGAEIDLLGVMKATRLELSLNSDDDYEILYMKGKKEIGSNKIAASLSNPDALAIYLLSVPSLASRDGFDRIRILPTKGSGKFYLGHLAFPD